MNEKEFNEKLEECRNDPSIGPLMQNLQAMTHKSVFSPEFSERWIKVWLWRDGNEIQIGWEASGGAEFLYNVQIVAAEIAFSSADGFGDQRIFPSHRGNGRMTGELEEGCSYYFRLCFWEDDKFNELILITFQIQIPLSADNKSLLAKAKHLEMCPEDEITRRAESYLNKLDRIDTVLAAGIARIKRKNLSLGEEDQRIEDFKENLKWMTEDIFK